MLAKPAYAAGVPGTAKFAGSYATFSGTLRATQFVDNDNPTYFIDPNATGTSLSVAGDLSFGGKILENGTEILSGMIAAFTTACPTGWTEYTAARGRTVVGTPASGTNAGTVGTALTNQQDKTHTHTGPSHTHTTGNETLTIAEMPAHTHTISQNWEDTPGAAAEAPWILNDQTPGGASGTIVVGSSATGGGTAHNHGATSASGTGATGTAATSDVIPYIQLTYCQKSAGADLAEWIQSNEQIEKTSIVSVDPNNSEKVVSSATEYDAKAIGIITSSPGWLLGTESKNGVQMTLAGRVPTKVTLKNGEIKPGDPITTSTIPGTGMKATKAGSIVGKAMEAFNETSSTYACQDPATGKTETYGTILVFVNISWYDPDVYLTSTGDLTIVKDGNGTYAVQNSKDNSVVTRIGAFAEAVVGKIRAGVIETKQLIVDGVDIVKKLDTQQKQIDELKKMVEGQDQTIRQLQTELEQLKAH